MLQKFLQKLESEQNQQTRQHLHTGTQQFAAAFSVESHVEEMVSFEEERNPVSLRKQRLDMAEE